MVLKRVLGCLFLLTLASGICWAQDSLGVSHTTPHGPITPAEPSSFRLIFSNIGPTSGDAYYESSGYNVDGPTNSADLSEQWIGVPFTPRVDAHVEQLQASIGLVSGTSLVQIGLYSDNSGTVGTQLAVGETATMPAFGTCCTLATVKITPTAVTAGTQYWIVGLPDDTNAPDFYGAWMGSNEANIGADVAQGGWETFNGLVPAAAARGTIP
jgi:hypothetical protein